MGDASEINGTFARKLCSPRRRGVRDEAGDSTHLSTANSPLPDLDPASPNNHFLKSALFSSTTSVISSSSSSLSGVRSPLRKQHSDADRFIPRRTEIDLHTQFSLSHAVASSAELPAQTQQSNSTLNPATAASPNNADPNATGNVYEAVLRARFQSSSPTHNRHQLNIVPETTNGLFQFTSPTLTSPSATSALATSALTTSPHHYLSSSVSPTSSPLRQGAGWARSPTKQRKISTTPYKVLDAPNLEDDFYLNLVDWSSNNVLAVALGPHVYLWNAYTGKVTKCYSATDAGGQDIVTSVCWVQKGTHLAIGTGSGKVDIVDTLPCKRIRTMTGHSNRVGTLCWNGSMLSSGSRDRLILNRDTTSPDHFVSRLMGHKQEVCGLKWSPDGKHLASGGNDNKLMLWSVESTKPLYKYSEHSAAVKAIAWSPHESGLLVSGGGTADRSLRFWNVHTPTSLKTIDTGSQICNLVWSQNVNEIVSTHGYSQNQIVVWRYPTMARLATLTGHTTRVLYLAVSPDGQNVVTGAGDETLRFWHLWPGRKAKDDSQDVDGTLPFCETQIR